MILKNSNITPPLTIALIILIGFFGYAQETKVNVNNAKNFNRLESAHSNSTRNKVENLKKIDIKKNDITEESSKPYKVIKNIKEDFRVVAIRFQERWLLTTLLT